MIECSWTVVAVFWCVLLLLLLLLLLLYELCTLALRENGHIAPSNINSCMGMGRGCQRVQHNPTTGTTLHHGHYAASYFSYQCTTARTPPAHPEAVANLEPEMAQ